MCRDLWLTWSTCLLVSQGSTLCHFSRTLVHRYIPLCCVTCYYMSCLLALYHGPIVNFVTRGERSQSGSGSTREMSGLNPRRFSSVTPAEPNVQRILCARFHCTIREIREIIRTVVQKEHVGILRRGFVPIATVRTRVANSHA